MNKNSKYLRKENEFRPPMPPRSRSEKNKSRPHKPSGRHYRKMSGQERYEKMMERENRISEVIEEQEAENQVAELPEENAVALAEQETVFAVPAPDNLRVPVGGGFVFNREDFKGQPDLSVDESESFGNRVLIRTVASCAVLTVAATVLQFLTFRLPLMPIFMRLDLSAIPELLAAVAFGPFAGIITIVVKNIVYIAAYHSPVLSTALSNIISDSLFVIIASLIYARGMFSPKAIEKMFEKEQFTKDKRMLQIIKSGFAAALITSAVNFFVLNYVTYPLIFKLFGNQGITAKIYIDRYQVALSALKGYLPPFLGSIIPDIDSILKGTLIYNIPISFGKMIFVTLFVAMVYRFLSDFLHYRHQ